MTIYYKTRPSRFLSDLWLAWGSTEMLRGDNPPALTPHPLWMTHGRTEQDALDALKRDVLTHIDQPVFKQVHT